MKNLLTLLLTIILLLNAQSLFEIKDASDNTVLEVSADGLRIFNMGDTLMVISSTEIKAFIDDSANDKALSRSFSVSTATSSKGASDVISIESDGFRVYNAGDKLMDITGNNITAYIDSSADKALSRSFSVSTATSSKDGYDILDVTTETTSMREGTEGNRYTDFSEKNIFVGASAGESVTIGSPYSYSGLYNLFIGNYAGQSLTSGYCNTYFGYMAGYASLTATHNSFFGYQAGMNNTTGSYNNVIGYQAGYEMTGGSSNNVMGYKAGYFTSSGTNNVFIGTEAGKSNSSGDYNVALGQSSGFSLNDGNSNILIGYESGLNTSDGDNNIFIGYQAGKTNSTGNDNQFMGYMSGQNNTSGSNSLFLGWKSGQNNTTGYENLFVGYNSGNANVGGFGNVLLGTYAGHVFTGGNENVMIGRGAGCYASTTCSNNVFIGSYAGYGNGENDGNVFIGYKVGYSAVGSDKLMIDNDSGADATTSLIYGDFSSDFLKFNANVGIGVSPSSLYGINVEDDYISGRFYSSTTSGSYTRGIMGFAIGGSSTNYGIYGYASGTDATNYAGYFYGNINVTGTVLKSADEIKIDHPLDPENKSLSHSTISSDQMTNLYNGNVILNSEGKAKVILPDWFESINSDYRYQLTAIGAPGPNLFISNKINNNSFEISGGASNMEVSWQIAAIRNDKFAQKNRIEVEKEKRLDEKGYYIHPAAYDLPEEKGIEKHIQQIEKMTIN